MKIILTITALTSLTLLSGVVSAAGDCQHPYCSMSSGYDAVHGIVDLPDPAPAATLPAADRLKAELAQVGAERFTAHDYKPGLVRHIVLFRYAPNVTAEQKAEAKDRFLALEREAVRDGRSYIVSIETGGELSGEGADQGLEQGFIVTFRSQGDRNYYVGQPIVTDPAYFDAAHQSFKDFVGRLLDQNGVIVFDFAPGGGRY